MDPILAGAMIGIGIIVCGAGIIALYFTIDSLRSARRYGDGVLYLITVGLGAMSVIFSTIGACLIVIPFLLFFHF